VKTIITIIVLICSSLSYAQNDSTNQTKVELFPSRYGEKKLKVLIGLDARRSFFAGTKIKINGLRLGAEFKGVHRFGFGFYWLSKNVIFHDVIDGQPTQDLIDPEVRFNLGYSSIFYERVFLKTRWWEVDLPIHLGGGEITGRFKDTLGAFQQFTKAPFSALVPSIQVKFYPFTWLAIRGSAGYRLTMSEVQEVKKTFRNGFYGYGLSVNIIGLYRAIFKKEKKVKIEGENTEEEIR